jgi:hypothetical protein
MGLQENDVRFWLHPCPGPILTSVDSGLQCEVGHFWDYGLVSTKKLDMLRLALWLDPEEKYSDQLWPAKFMGRGYFIFSYYIFRLLGQKLVSPLCSDDSAWYVRPAIHDICLTRKPLVASILR